MHKVITHKTCWFTKQMVGVGHIWDRKEVWAQYSLFCPTYLLTECATSCPAQLTRLLQRHIPPALSVITTYLFLHSPPSFNLSHVNGPVVSMKHTLHTPDLFSSDLSWSPYWQDPPYNITLLRQTDQRQWPSKRNKPTYLPQAQRGWVGVENCKETLFCLSHKCTLACACAYFFCC